MSDVALPLLDRLLLSVQDFLGTPIAAELDPDGTLEAARAALVAGTRQRRRDEDRRTPGDEENLSVPRLVITGQDMGRYKQGTPIRTMHLELQIHANAKLAEGLADPFAQLRGAVETLLDGLNLTVAFSSEARGIAVMCGNRRPGVRHAAHGDLRVEVYAAEVQGVALEHTS